MAWTETLSAEQRDRVSVLLEAVATGTMSIDAAVSALQTPGGAGAGGMPSDRYVDLGEAGRGGMAEVRKVHDQLLDRVVAMKFMHWHLIEQPKARRRFINEANITAGLAHPGIVAVHDRGEFAGVRPWFTMKFIEGETLDEATAERPLRRLIEAFARVCEAMAYAHARGVVHRDLKPQNIMIGAFGEVLVLDWGLARRIGDGPTSIEGGETNAAHTQLGDVMGTPAYMSPEQAGGGAAQLGPSSDVYALGAILYRLLSGAAPYDGTVRAVLRAVRDGVAPTLEAGPAPLRAICGRAMARAPDDRYPDAGALAEAIRAWLDGDARRARALRLVEQARAAWPRGKRLRQEAQIVERRAQQMLAGVPPYAPIVAKRPAWLLEDDAAARRREARISDAEALRLLRAALAEAPDLVEARSLLTETYRAALLDAEARHDRDAAEEWAFLLRTHDPAGNTAWLKGDGTVSLRTEPPGATVRVARYRLVDRHLIELPVDMGVPPTPWDARRFPMGSYLLTLEAPGCAPVRYPLHIARGGTWTGRPPGATETAAIPLPAADAVAPDHAYVPAGWFICGGDPEAPDGLSQRRIWVDGIVIERHPVTNTRYLAFLNDLLAHGREPDALRWAPKEHARDTHAYGRDADGRFVLGHAHDMEWLPDGPVVLISWDAATAFAHWQAARDGLPWRLPHSIELEKATRGVDGRRFVWGDHFDPTWARVMDHDADPPRITAVGSDPVDESVYGVRDLAGNVRDLCIDGYVREGVVGDGQRVVVTPPTPAQPFRTIKGGSFNSRSTYCRAATRFALRPDMGVIGVGFRLCRPFRPEDRSATTEA